MCKSIYWNLKWHTRSFLTTHRYIIMRDVYLYTWCIYIYTHYIQIYKIVIEDFRRNEKEIRNWLEILYIIPYLPANSFLRLIIIMGISVTIVKLAYTV